MGEIRRITMKKIIISFVSVILLLALTASFTVNAQTAQEIFSDVEAGKWYTEAINFCYQHGYMNGVSKNEFGTNIGITRAMFATLIGSIDNANREMYGSKGIFKDVQKGKWYSSSVEWAYDNCIVAGVDNGVFAPDAKISRESMALMLYKYALISGIDVSKKTNLDSFADSSDVHEWAKNALEWAVESSIIGGYNGRLNPRATATRAEVAVMLKAFVSLGLRAKADDFTVSRAFSDDMIVQRDEKLTVWGFAPEVNNGKIVRVFFRGKVTSAVIENGEWKAVFRDTFPASTDKETITVRGGSYDVNIKNVMTGDVYYVIGQSNVYWSMEALINDLIASGNYEGFEYDYDDNRNIRLFQNSSAYYMNMEGEDRQGTVKLYKDVVSDQAKWLKPSNYMTPEFSAVGYLTAYNLSKKTDVPIGMIEIDASGYALTAFSPNELCDRWGSDINYMNTGIYYFKLGDTVYPMASRFAYNQQLHPLENFSCAGIIWYQGESDSNNTIHTFGKDKYTFTSEFTELMKYFRSHFGNSDFPVYIMEFPSSYKLLANSFISFGVVRSEIGTIPTMLENSYVIPCSDVWPISKMFWSNNLHPYCKPEQAKRTADMILANRYGIGNKDDVFGPQFESVTYPDEYTAVIKFKYVGDGLGYSDDEGIEMIFGFETLENPNSYSEDWEPNNNVKITGKNEVTVTSKVPIYGVRYNAQTEYYFPDTVNMHNSAKVPMVAFVDYKN